MERREPKKFRKGLIRNLLDRELGTQYSKRASIKRTFAHPYQLLDTLQPKRVCQLNLLACATQSSRGTDFGTLAECLGFSPDGRYLAFHSHARNAISVLFYSGIEGVQVTDGVASVSSIFGKRQIFDHCELLRGWNYTSEKTVASWWTDDSSTLIIQLKLVELDADERIGAEDIMARPNRLLNNPRGVWTGGRRIGFIPPNLPEIVQSHLRAQDQLEFARMEAEWAMDNGEEEEEEEDDGREVNVVDDVEEEEPIQEEPDQEAGPSNYEESREEIRIETGETSRTIPFWIAIDSASEMARDGRNIKNETSRTMTVYHALTSSMLLDDVEGQQFYEEEEEEDDEEQSTSTHFVETEHNRSERLRMWMERSRSSSNSSRFGVNRTGLGYNRQPKISYAQRLRDAIGEQRPLEPERPKLPDFDPDDPRVNLRNSFVILAYNVQDNSVAPLMFRSVYRKFHCQMRNRNLMVAYNNDFIETFVLDATDGKWRVDKEFQLSRRMQIPNPIFYRTDKMDGKKKLLERPTTGTVIGHFYCYNAFYSPIQQLFKSLLYKDMPRWFKNQEAVRRLPPNLTRCRLITHDTIAATICYLKRPNADLIQHGVIIRMDDESITIYPDFLKFLQLLFTHHMPDLLPRQWTYLNPSPVHLQKWFKEAIIDISDKDQFNNYTRMVEAYDLISEFWNTPKSASNPTADDRFFDGIHADLFLTKYVYVGNGDEAPGVRSAPNSNERPVELDRFMHPNDPFVIFSHANIWFVSMPANLAH